MQTYPERRWDRSSRLVLAFALFLFVYSNVLGWRMLQVPGDGWMWDDSTQTATPEIRFTTQVIGPPTLLQPGDKLIMIEGETVEALVERAFRRQLAPPPGWSDGTMLEYVVEREGQILTVAVPVHRYTFAELLIAGIRHEGLPGLVQLAGSIFFFVVGVIVFVLRPRQRAAHALLILGTAFLFNSAPTPGWTTTFFYPFRPPSVPLDTWTLAINPSLMLLALAFPIPKWPMRRYPRPTTLFLFLWAPLAINAAYLLNLGDPPGYYNAATAVYVLQVLMLFILVFGSLIHSTFKIREPVARNQLKWVGLGLASFVLPGVGGWLLGFMGVQNQAVYLLTVVGWFIMPICLAIAITRYRLFDIDVIIRKTLVYAALSGLLALIYFGSVVLLQNVVGRVSGEQSPLIIVVSTLLIAALFAPLRQRVQMFIDRRFFRRKYNAQRVLAEFAQTARDEVSLEALAAELTRVVQETMQPERVAIWVKGSEK